MGTKHKLYKKKIICQVYETAMFVHIYAYNTFNYMYTSTYPLRFRCLWTSSELIIRCTSLLLITWRGGLYNIQKEQVNRTQERVVINIIIDICSIHVLITDAQYNHVRALGFQ